MEQNIKTKNIFLIMLGQDSALLDPKSEAVERTNAYADSFSGIYAYVFAKKISFKESIHTRLTVLGFSTLRQSFFAFFEIYRNIKGLQKKGYATILTTQDPFEIGFIGYIISRITRIPFHVQVHTDISSEYMQQESLRTRIQYLLSLFVLSKADRIRVVSQRLENFCIQKLNIKKNKVDNVPMLYKRDITMTSSSFGVVPHIIILPARFVWFKRIPLALQAFWYVIQKNKNVRLHIIGSGPMQKEIEKNVLDLGITEYVKIIPWMKAEDLYENATLTLISSIYEGWCRVAVESIEAGVPVVMTDVGCAREFVIDTQEGAVVPIEDPEALAYAIGKILKDESTYIKYRNACSEKRGEIQSFVAYQTRVVQSWLDTTFQEQ